MLASIFYIAGGKIWVSVRYVVHCGIITVKTILHEFFEQNASLSMSKAFTRAIMRCLRNRSPLFRRGTNSLNAKLSSSV